MTMRRMLILLLIFAFTLVLVAGCNTNVENKSDNPSNSLQSTEELAIIGDEDDSTRTDSAVDPHDPLLTEDRLIVHRAHVDVCVKEMEEARLAIEKKVNTYEGYIVEENMYRDPDEQLSGRMMIRIPDTHFQTFLQDVEELVSEVFSRQVTGEDVTEEYVDLESRLKSKRTVEERLLQFIKDAEQTEDLLKISNELAQVQEEIELLVGQKNVLDNQISFSTVELMMQEDRIVVPGIDGTDLNTWDKTKRQFAASVNFLLSAASGLIVFTVGNLPVIITLLLIAFIIYVIIKRRSKNEHSNE